MAPLVCTAQAASVPVVRAEGLTELVGDVVLVCTGGEPRALAQTLPQFNLQVYTSPGIGVTSRALAAGGTGAFTEALLFIDEPGTAEQTICGSPAYPYSTPPGVPSTVIAGVCGAHAGSPAGDGRGTYNPNAAAPAGTYRGNVYQARQIGTNSLVWQGVPFDPPGDGKTRVLRLTNIRVNASELGVPINSHGPISLFLATNASGLQNPIAVPLGRAVVTVATASHSLSSSPTPVRCLQCESSCNGEDPRLTVRETFPTAWRRRSTALPLDTPATPVSPVPQGQDTLGIVFQTESGFYRSQPNANRWPAVLANSTPAAGVATGTLGLADHGTRLMLRFQNVPAGLRIYMPPVVAIRSQQANGARTGLAFYVATGPNGAGPFTLPLPADVETPDAWPEVAIEGGAGAAVYEILSTDTTAIEEIEFRIDVSYSGTSSTPVAPGTMDAAAVLAPQGPTPAALPRFAVLPAGPSVVMTMNTCRTNILFPFISNQSGFDTGLAIANTAKDPFYTTGQTGPCQVHFHGAVGTSKVSLMFPSQPIGPGEHLLWTLSSGGAVAATPGFQGYAIASCHFQYGHGYAFLSDAGATRLAMGYLALVMDEALTPARTGDRSEVANH